MAAILRAEVKLPYTSNIPRDVSMNVFHFLTPDDPGEGEFIEIAEALVSFYNDTHTGQTISLAEYISAVVSRATNACEITISNVDDDPSLPLLVAEWSLNETFEEETTSLPLEVACCLSFRATPLLPTPIRRRTGRIYLGPLFAECITYNANDMPTIGVEMREDLCAAMLFLATGDHSANEQWAVYSRVAGQAYEVSQGWVDNETDTQRRRQKDPTARSIWSI